MTHQRVPVDLLITAFFSDTCCFFLSEIENLKNWKEKIETDMTEEGDVDGLTYNNDGSFQTSNEQLGKCWKKKKLPTFFRLLFSWLK